MTVHSARAASGVVLAAALLVIASCGGSSGTVAQSAAGISGQAAPPAQIRLALAPDPIWQWLEDSGTVARFESAHNIRIEASKPFDPFSAFAGGHADIVVIDALVVPQFAEQSGREPVIIGQLASDRSILAVRRTSQAETLDDLIEATIAVDNSLGRVLLWGLIADSKYALDLRAGGSPDFNITVVESGSVADVVMGGDADACICLPELSVSHLANGMMRPLYGGRNAAEIYAKDVISQALLRPLADVFVADKQWLARNRHAVGALLELWQVGLDHWTSGKGQIIADYPHLFSVRTAEEVDWMTAHASQRDWVSRSAYLTLDNRRLQDHMFARMRSTGLVPDDTVTPLLDLSYPADQ